MVDLVDEDELLDGIDPMSLVVDLDDDKKNDKTAGDDDGNNKKSKDHKLKGKKG